MGSKFFGDGCRGKLLKEMMTVSSITMIWAIRIVVEALVPNL